MRRSCHSAYRGPVTSDDQPTTPVDPTVGQWQGVDINFGEHGAKLTYGSYLQLTKLLSAQQLESSPPAHDELLFITIHQVYELWFQQLLHEAQTARDAMFGDQLWWAKHLLNRAHVIERVLVEQVDVLETMTPQDFLAFRQLLSPASGFQSVQYRELEFLSGAKDPSFVRRFRGLTDDERARLAAAAGRADSLGCVRGRTRTSRTGDRQRRADPGVAAYCSPQSQRALRRVGARQRR